MTGMQPRGRQRKLLDAGPFEPLIGSFWLHLAAEGKATKTVRIYADAVAWFAAAHLLPETGKSSWEQVDEQDVQRWIVGLLGRYSDAYANNQFRALLRRYGASARSARARRSYDRVMTGIL